MITSVEGVVLATHPDSVVIQVGGVGLQVFAPTGTLSALGGAGARARLHTHLYFKEDHLALYGFATEEELRLFGLLMNVAGVGPRNALRMLSVLRPAELAAAIAGEDLAALTRVPGVGRKLAGRIVLELRGVLEREWGLTAEGLAPAPPEDSDAVAALTALGYTRAEARAALAGVDDAGALSLEDKVTRALQRMAAR